MAKTKLGSNAQFLGPNLGLSIVSDRCYAYSGKFPASTSEQTVLDFDTGAEVIVGLFTFNGLTRIASSSDGGITAFQVQFNGTVVSQSKSDSAGHDSPTQTFQEIIIPPFTSVKVVCISSEDTANEAVTVVLTGRIYA